MVFYHIRVKILKNTLRPNNEQNFLFSNFRNFSLGLKGTDLLMVLMIGVIVLVYGRIGNVVKNWNAAQYFYSTLGSWQQTDWITINEEFDDPECVWSRIKETGVNG